jgi:plasmid stability protein
MGQLILKDLDNEVIANLQWKAKLHGHSLEQELQEILTAAAKPTQEELLEIANHIRAMTWPGTHPLAEDIIRCDRDNQ